MNLETNEKKQNISLNSKKLKIKNKIFSNKQLKDKNKFLTTRIKGKNKKEIIESSLKLRNKIMIHQNKLYNQYSSIVTDCLVYNKNCTYNSKFKDYLISDYVDEFCKRYYKTEEIKVRIPKISNYYKNYLKFFCKPVFSEFHINFLIQGNGDFKAELYYKINYGEKKKSDKQKKLKREDMIFVTEIKNNIDHNSLTKSEINCTTDKIVDEINGCSKKIKKKVENEMDKYFDCESKISVNTSILQTKRKQDSFIEYLVDNIKIKNEIDTKTISKSNSKTISKLPSEAKVTESIKENFIINREQSTKKIDLISFSNKTRNKESSDGNFMSTPSLLSNYQTVSNLKKEQFSNQIDNLSNAKNNSNQYFNNSYKTTVKPQSKANLNKFNINQNYGCNFNIETAIIRPESRNLSQNRNECLSSKTQRVEVPNEKNKSSNVIQKAKESNFDNLMKITVSVSVNKPTSTSRINSGIKLNNLTNDINKQYSSIRNLKSNSVIKNEKQILNNVNININNNVNILNENNTSKDNKNSRNKIETVFKSKSNEYLHGNLNIMKSIGGSSMNSSKKIIENKQEIKISLTKK